MNIPQYYRIRTPHHDFILGAAPRSASTSVHFMAKGLECGMIQEEDVERAVCIIRHPLERLSSAWLLFPLEARRLPVGDGEVNRVAMRPPIEEAIDAILDGHGEEFFTATIGSSKHAYAWQRQSELYSRCLYPVWVRLDGIESIYGLELPLYNVAEDEKPAIEHRVDELLGYYQEDMMIWNEAPTKI